MWYVFFSPLFIVHCESIGNRSWYWKSCTVSVPIVEWVWDGGYCWLLMLWWRWWRRLVFNAQCTHDDCRFPRFMWWNVASIIATKTLNRTPQSTKNAQSFILTPYVPFQIWSHRCHGRKYSMNKSNRNECETVLQNANNCFYCSFKNEIVVNSFENGLILFKCDFYRYFYRCSAFS